MAAAAGTQEATPVAVQQAGAREAAVPVVLADQGAVDTMAAATVVVREEAVMV